MEFSINSTALFENDLLFSRFYSCALDEERRTIFWFSRRQLRASRRNFIATVIQPRDGSTMKDDANSRKMDLASPNRSKRSSVTTPRRSAAAVGGGGTSALVQSFREALDDLVVEHDKPTSRSAPLTSQRQQRKKEDILGFQITKILNQQPEFRQPLHLGFDRDSLESLSCYPTLQPLISSRNWRWLRRKLQEGVSLLLSQKESLGDVRIVFSFVFWNTKSLSSGISTFCASCFLFLAAGATITTFATVWTIQCSWIILATALACLADLNEIRHLIPTPIHRIFICLVNSVKNFDKTVLLGRRYQGREWGKSDFEYDDGKSAPSFGQYLWDMPPPLSSEEAKAERRNDRLDWSEDTKTHIQAIDFCQTMLREAFVRKQYGKLRKAVFKRKKTNSMEMARKKSNEDLSEDYDLTRSSSGPASLDIDEVETFKIETLMEETDLPGGHFDGVNLSALDGILADDDNSFSSNSTTHHQDRSQNSTDSDTDLNWMDVGAEIGKKLLSSAAVQKAMTSHDTAERIVTIKENFEEKMAAQANVDTGAESELWARGETGSRGKTPAAALPPVHSMWTSASAAAQVAVSPDNTVDSNRSVDPISRNRQIVESIRIDDTKPSQKPFVLSPRRMSSKNEVWGESEESLPELGPKSPKQLITSPQHLGKSACDSPIEVVRESLCHSQTPKELRKVNRRAQLLSGVKIAVPIFPYQPGSKSCRVFHRGNFQMATVLSSKRLAIFQKNSLPPPGKRQTNCLAITVQLDKSFLREGKFAVMTLRIMDDWPDRYMPKHSKFPIGSCVATSFGVGVLVGWRIEDDCHVVRSLWQRRGPGSASAYLRRDAIHSTTGAATGFEVVTKLGIGEIKGYTHAGSDFRMGRYLVEMTGPGKHHDQTLALNKGDIVSCKSARFIPVIEHIREAVQYQLQVDRYNDSMEPHDDDLFESMKGKHWQKISTYSDILWKSFLRATEEDDEFDEGMNDFIASIVSFFETLDAQPGSIDSNGKDVSNIVITATDSSKSQQREETTEPGFLNDFFGFFGGNGLRKNQDPDESIEIEVTDKLNEAAAMVETEKNYNKAFAVIRTLMRTVSIARAGCTDEPEFKLGLSLCYEFLLFIKTVVRVQQKNMNPHSLQIWKRALDEIVSTFGPIKERLERIGKGIAERMEKHGRRAKVRLLRFVDIIVQDDTLLMSMEQGDWPRCFEQIELALVMSKIIDEQSREHYHRTAQYVVKHFVDIATKNSTAAARNNEKLEKFAAVIKCIAAPRKFLLRLLVQDWVLDALERVLVRVFDDEDVAFQMLSIHASNFHSLRQFRMLKDFTIAGKFWMPLLDAADAEFSFLSSQMPDGAKDYIVPLSSLFSLCVLQFHKIDDGDLTKDWLDFLLEEEAVNIIHDIDVKLILALESFSRDVKEMMVVLPYYPRFVSQRFNATLHTQCTTYHLTNNAFLIQTVSRMISSTL